VGADERQFYLFVGFAGQKFIRLAALGRFGTREKCNPHTI
jgi:hypothetical protein